MRKKREYQSSELVKVFAKKFGFEDKLVALEIRDFLKDYLDNTLYEEIESVNLKEGILFIKVKSTLLRNDLRMRKSFFLKKFQEQKPDQFDDLVIM